MLRRTWFVLISLFCLAGFLAAQEATETKNNNPKLEEKVLMDFGNLPDDLGLDRWRIQLSGFSDIPLCRILSDLTIVPVDSAKVETTDKFSKCLGVRIYFDYSWGNDWAQIKTFSPLSDYYSKEGQGVLRNVGPIKSVSLTVLGRNYKNSVEVRMVDQNGLFKSINFGSLFFRGWRKLTWENPDFIKDARKRDIQKEHLYPQYAPFLKFDSIVLYKSPQELGGDFVVYVKDVRVEYEPALLKYEDSVDDEAIWKIQETKAKEQKMKDDKFFDTYYSGSTKEEQYLKDKAKRDKVEKTSEEKTTETK
ncbi:MAG: flagellar filament outer layer protein FlaA [bacterium]|nr:flagellar filament outer layer protein FlaA [bacterium]